MNLDDLLARVAKGEDSATQFKVDVRNGESLASEMAAFANAEGGTILIGVADDGSMPGLSRRDVARINQLIGNAASHLVRSPLTVQTENLALPNGRLVIALTVPKGIDKPYFDKNGVIWLKNGADKRRVNSKEELRRLFQMTAQFHADELPTKAGLERLDKLRFRDFLRDVFKQDDPDPPAELTRLLQNMNLAAPIRLFVYDHRIEIISPGHLPDNLTVEKMLAGNSNIRNPILVSYVAKGLLPYHGLGSGIKRALDAWPRIDFADDHDGCLFTATVHRQPVSELKLVPGSSRSSVKTPSVSSGKGSGKILHLLRENGQLTIPKLASRLGITTRAVEKNIRSLQGAGLLKRVGGRKEGHWQVIDQNQG